MTVYDYDLCIFWPQRGGIQGTYNWVKIILMMTIRRNGMPIEGFCSMHSCTNIAYLRIY